MRECRFQRCAKRHPVTPNAFSTARRTADSTDCGQPPAALDAFQRRPCQKQPPAAPDTSSVRETAPALFVRSGPFHHFLRPANAELVSGGPFPCSFDGTRYRKRPPLKDAQNGLRSEVSRHKKGAPRKERTSIKLYDLIISPEIWRPVPLQDVR